MNPEFIECIALIKWADLAKKAYPELAWLYHVPNEGKRSKAAAGITKAMGMKKGVPDYFLPVPRGGYHGFYIEMKKPGEKPTQEQAEFLAFAAMQGYLSMVCYSWDGAANALKNYLDGQIEREVPATDDCTPPGQSSE